MRAGKGSQEEDEYEEEEFGSSKKQGTSSAPNTNKGTFLIFIEKKTMFVWLYFIPTLLLDPIIGCCFVLFEVVWVLPGFFFF